MPGKHQHFQEPEVGCCGKYFLFGFNIVFWVLGALFLAIGLWAWSEKGVLSNISALTDLGGLDPVWLFVVVGGVMSVLGFAGCIGALRENTFLLKFFSVFLGLIFFLELATGILAFVFKDWIRDQLNLFINNNVKAYRDDIDLQNLIDFAQEYTQPTRLCRPWDSPDKNTGVGCHFLLQCMKVKSESEVAQLCLTLSDPTDCSLPGSSIHGVFQARVLEWVAIAFSRKRARTCLCVDGDLGEETDDKQAKETNVCSIINCGKS
ncbi:tetraspanin-17 isoform X2 [Moschus berezovskii]|uniref:tetraspanin-17 isoform X2 n=1 Tax=Moschus berezovskii TaxID=68408 RepID=UPI0024453372|nr:tetraspanin-17 isoform X2 [Moschus berezovskii]